MKQLVIAIGCTLLAGAALAADTGSKAPGAAQADMGRMHAGFAKPIDAAAIKVAKATGPDARTVAEIVGQRLELKDKSVTVRGKVVKFTPEVMGKNWIHLRDGSGSEAEHTNDVLVTSKDAVTVGDVVVAKGVVRTDVDLGHGYAYRVLVEEARLQK
jgi:hypothetical protein